MIAALLALFRRPTPDLNPDELEGLLHNATARAHTNMHLNRKDHP